MDHPTRIPAVAHVIAASILLVGLAACGDKLSNTASKTPDPVPPSTSTVLIGTAPAQPSGDPPGTTPVAPGTTDVTKSVESAATPQPGQANDHSNEAAKPSQKSGEIAKTPEEGKRANN